MSNFNNVEVQDHFFTLTASQSRSINPNTLILSQTTNITTFSAAQFSGVQFWAFDASNTQNFLNGNTVTGYLLNSTGEYGLSNFTLPAGNWAFGELYNGSLSGLQPITGFDEVSIVTLPGASFINNVPLAVSGNAGTWESQGFTITGNPATYIETEGTGGSFMIMNDAQFLAFQAGNASGYHGGGYSYTYALGGTSGGPSTEIEGEMLLNSGHWNLVWINDTGGWAGGAANISAFGSSGGLTLTSNPTTPSSGNDLRVTLNDITTNMGIGNPSTTTTAGGYVNLHYTLYNTFATSQPAVVQLYVSTDPTITTSDTPNVDAPVLGTIFFDPIPANGSLEGTTTLHLPSNLAPGTYYVGLIIDFQNKIAESNENNNASAGMAITVTGNSTYNGHSYTFVSFNGTALSWSQARDAAVAMGGYLATITSQGENDFILNNIAAGHLTNGATAAFIGASDSGHEGIWQWATGPEAGTTFWNGEFNGTAVSGQYANWSPGEPSNATNNADGSENYGVMEGNGTWNDVASIRPANVTVGYIVEFSNSSGIPSTPLTFHSTSANETFVGGFGDDTAVYSGSVNQYTVQKSGASFLVIDSILTRDGTDTLTNIEHVQFTDRSINLTMPAEAAKLSATQINSLVELYVAYFNRVPEASGLAYWIDKVAAGETLTQVSQEFYAAGVQFSSVTGYSANMSNAAFIQIVYANVLGRTGSTAPDASEIAYWDNQISTGATTKDGLIQRMLSDAHSFAGDPTWGWVANLLNNKIAVGNVHAVQLGVDYNSSSDAITQTVAIAHAVTPTDTTAAINLIGLVNNVHLT